MAHPEMRKYLGIPPLVTIEYGPENFNVEGVLTCMLLTMGNRNYKMVWKEGASLSLIDAWKEVGKKILRCRWCCGDIIDEMFLAVGAKFIFNGSSALQDIIDKTKRDEVGFHDAIGVAKVHFKINCNHCLDELRKRK